MLNLDLKINHSIWKGAVFALGMSFLLVPMAVTPARATTVGELRVSLFHVISRRAYSQNRRSKWGILTRWWNDNFFGGDPSKEMNDIAAAKSVRTNSLTIPLLKGCQKIVGTGKYQQLFLGWAGNDNRSYTVITKRKGQQCLIGENCWKTETIGNSTSVRVLLEKGEYQVTVTEKYGRLSATGDFVAVSYFDKEKWEKHAVKQLLTKGKNKWKFSAYQQMAKSSDKIAQLLKLKLEEGLTIAIVKK